MENKFNHIERLKGIYNCFLGEKGVVYVENNFLEACNNVVKFYEAMKPTLTEEDAYILDRIFGIHNAQMSYDELAKDLNMTSDDIREISARAIRKLKHPSRSRIGYAILLGVEPKPYVKEEKVIVIPNDLSELLIEDIPFSVRTYNVLKRGSINNLLDLVNTTMGELVHIRNVGKRTIIEIEEFLNKYNLKLKG